MREGEGEVRERGVREEHHYFSFLSVFDGTSITTLGEHMREGVGEREGE